MLNAPRTQTNRRNRLGAFHTLRHVAQRPSGRLSVGNRSLSVEVIGAVGFDVHLNASSPVSVGQRVTLILAFSEAEPEIALPGLVHWVGSGDSACQAGIILQEALPDDLSTRISSCLRNSIRYACRLPGTMLWTGDVDTSCAAVAKNYSRDGICFQAELAPPVETKIQFAWTSDGNENCVEGMIRWVIGQENGCLIGCELVDNFGYRLNGVKG